MLHEPAVPDPSTTGRAELVLFDRDGTLVRDVPYNHDPTAVVEMPGARAALERLRSCGIGTAVITNQAGVARGLLDERQVMAVNARVDELLGPFDAWEWCPHGPDDRCGCRKPCPGMVHAACARLGVSPADVVVVGDIGSDVGAARSAGARSVLVPTPTTERGEVESAPVVARDLDEAVSLILDGRV